jgi:hypothetical protein
VWLTLFPAGLTTKKQPPEFIQYVIGKGMPVLKRYCRETSQPQAEFEPEFAGTYNNIRAVQVIHTLCQTCY